MQTLRKVKIIATVGPASQSKEMLKELVLAGANVFRLNLSHGDHAFHRETFHLIRSLEADVGRHIGILMDLQGPKLRIDKFQENHITLTAGQSFILDQHSALGDDRRVCLPHPELFQALKPGHFLLLDDGKIKLKVTAITADSITTEVMVGGILSNHKGVNVPHIHLPIPALTDKDKQDALFAASMGADFLAISFVQTAKDVEELRRLTPGQIPIISKIEKPQAIHFLEEIVQASDGIMVARGDLGVEISPEEVPGLQKKIIRMASRYGKPVVVATQMLESMIVSSSPTRAEASDVATAVYDGTDCVMLSAESAAGKYPVEAVSMMEKIISCAETDELYPSFLKAIEYHHPKCNEDAITVAARKIIKELHAKALGVFSAHGTTILSAANKRPLVPIIGIMQDEKLARQLTLVWGVYPLIVPEFLDFKEMILQVTAAIQQKGFATSGDKLVFTGSIPLGQPGTTNLLSIETIP